MFGQSSLDWFEDPPSLRWYQEDGVAAIRRALALSRACLTVMATGLGKTVTFSHLAKGWPGKVLVLAHRDELIDQAQRSLSEVTGEYVDVEKAEFRASLRSRLVVGSVQTFAKRRKRFPKDHFSLVVPDEAHHFVSPSFRAILDYFSEAKVAGFTATPDRGDKLALGQLFDSVAYQMDILDGIEQGYLVPIEAHRVQLKEIDLEGVKVTAGDLQAGQLDEAMLRAIEGVTRKTLELAPGRRGIVFLPGVRSAEYCALKFNELETGSAVFISGATERDERRAIVRDFRAGKYRFLCNCAVATEGFDAPSADLIVQARPTLSRLLYAQMMGRGTRPLPGLVDGLYGAHRAAERKGAIAGSFKPNCLVLDFVGNSRHSLVGPEDVLGGVYSEDEVAEAKRAAKEKPQREVQVSLRDARETLRKIAEALSARVTAEVSKYDPFHALCIEVSPEDKSMFSKGAPATEGQLLALRAKGIPDEELGKLSRRAARALLDNLAERKAQGLATYKQMLQLRRFGVNDAKLSFERASSALTYIQQNGWGRGFPIDAGAVRALVRGETNA